MTSTTTTTVAKKEEPPQPTESNITGKSAIQAISQGATLPSIPSFTSADKKRRWMLEHMAGAFRVFARKGFSEGMSGHISLRDPEHPDCFWTNPYDFPPTKSAESHQLKTPQTWTPFRPSQSIRSHPTQPCWRARRGQPITASQCRGLPDPRRPAQDVSACERGVPCPLEVR